MYRKQALALGARVRKKARERKPKEQLAPLSMMFAGLRDVNDFPGFQYFCMLDDLLYAIHKLLINQFTSLSIK